MADARTKKELLRRKLKKLFCLAVLGFVFGCLVLVFLSYKPEWKNLITGRMAQWLTFFAPFLSKDFLDSHGWLAVPIFFSGLAMGSYKTPWIGKWIDKEFPDPPFFVRSSLLEAKKETMLLLESELLPFVGRENELEALRVFAMGNREHPFLWTLLTGPTGIGKTRLAIEWLVVCRGKDWDTGILDPKDIERISGWQPRRPTALVIDSLPAEKNLCELLALLGENADKEKRLRVLVVDQMEPHLNCSVGKRQEMVMKARYDKNSPALAELADEHVKEMAGYADFEIDERLLERIGGRPRKALLFFRAAPGTRDYESALLQWAEKALSPLLSPRAAINKDMALSLALSSLTGPVPVGTVCKNLGVRMDPLAMAQFFTPEENSRLKRELPLLQPVDLAFGILLVLLPHLTEAEEENLCHTALSSNPDALESRLMAFWRLRAGFGKDAHTFFENLQKKWDEAFPDHVEAIRERAERCLAHLRGEVESEKMESTLRILEDLVDSRLHDSQMRELEAEVAFLSMLHYGKAKEFEKMEAWGKRLIRLCENPDFKDNTEIRIWEARAAVNAIRHYGTAKEFEKLEVWGKRLITLCENPNFKDNPEIRLEEAKAAVNAFRDYETAKKFEKLEAWGERLITLCENSLFKDNPEIRLCEAMTAVNAISHYGRAKEFEKLETWGKRLITLCENPLFKDNPEIRLCEAAAAVNAFRDYGRAKEFEKLEVWGKRLITLCEDPLFQNNPEIRLCEAKAANNAIHDYGTAKEFEKLETWGNRLITLCENPLFKDNSAIRLCEAAAAVNAFRDYGTAKEFEKLEVWGKRLITLCEDPLFQNNPEIRLNEAKAAYNAIQDYDSEGDGYVFWRSRLKALAHAFPLEPKIQEIALKCHIQPDIQKLAPGWTPSGEK